MVVSSSHFIGPLWGPGPPGSYSLYFTHLQSVPVPNHLFCLLLRNQFCASVSSIYSRFAARWRCVGACHHLQLLFIVASAQPVVAARCAATIRARAHLIIIAYSCLG
jgi:hypothetical protein